MSLWLIYISYIALGGVAGLLSGLLGVGGGVIVVPGYLWLFKQQGFSANMDMHMATATSLAAMIVTASFSLYAHMRREASFSPILYIMIPCLIVGTSAGAIFADFTNAFTLKMLFGVLLVGLSLAGFFKGRNKQSSQKERVLKRHIGTIGIMTGSSSIGILSGLLGVGGGSILIPFLEYCGIGIKKAVSISISCGLVIALTGTIATISTGLGQPNLPSPSIGYIYLPAFIGVAIGSPVFTFLGARFHRHLDVYLLKTIFNIFLLIVGLRLLF